ncbi:hypothetical protein ScalyP_jg8913 [Parmales sp. scaly parma]|nr:hypothetical protein ScalyP_jg8913 [Parmales sp. scaly parma]
MRADLIPLLSNVVSNLSLLRPRGVHVLSSQSESIAALTSAAFAITSLPPSSSIVIMTGFPCLTTSPPTETDGPNGAFALVRCLNKLGHKTLILTNECDYDVMNCVGMTEIEKFPPTSSWTTRDDARLQQIADTKCDHIISIERPGLAADNNYYTMSGRSMNSDVAPLEKLLTIRKPGVSCTAIGDGGIELGMGKVYDRILTSEIPNKKLIGSTISCDNLILCAVSNWGGYALAGAVANSVDCLPSKEEETEILRKVVAAGARDGILRVQGGMTVDGLSLEENLDVLGKIQDLVKNR